MCVPRVRCPGVPQCVVQPARWFGNVEAPVPLCYACSLQRTLHDLLVHLVHLNPPAHPPGRPPTHPPTCPLLHTQTAAYLRQGGCQYKVQHVNIWNLPSWDVQVSTK